MNGSDHKHMRKSKITGRKMGEGSPLHIIAKRIAGIGAVKEIDVTNECHWKLTVDHTELKGKALDSLLGKVLEWGVTFKIIRLADKKEVFDNLHLQYMP